MPSRIDSVLDAARARLDRLDAREVPGALRRGAVLVDIRPAAQRAREGEVPAALVIERNVLEWRCDPTSEAKLPQAVDDHVEWVVLCSKGYTSSLAAASCRTSACIGPPMWRRLPGAARRRCAGGPFVAHASACSIGRSFSVLAAVNPAAAVRPPTR